jgi:adenine-specific DNA-methyltransferase
MDKLKMHSPDLTQQNIDRIAELFPTVVTERRDDDGNPVRAIDFDLLRQELSDHVVEGTQERYQLDWPGKREALFAANAPIAKTLRPVREESVDFDTTKNLFIEGDNLDALKLLQESYLGKVKLIYVDPPYNTGGDFVYRDNYAQNSAEYLASSGQSLDDGSRLVANVETNGRFHSDWLSMVYPRLRLARNLLSDDGAIFISIDDNEAPRMRMVCDEVFGETCFEGTITWEKRTKAQNTQEAADQLQSKTEYILVYKRATAKMHFTRDAVGELVYDCEDGVGPYRLKRLEEMSALGMRGRKTMRFDVLGVSPGPDKQWKLGSDAIEAFRDRGDLLLVEGWPTLKVRPSDESGQRYSPFWSHFFDKDAYGTAESGKKTLDELLGTKRHGFETVKPVPLLKTLVKRMSFGEDAKSFLCLDLFAGSGTLGQAVMELNAEDGGCRRFILVQYPEPIDEAGDLKGEGFETIAELCRKRVVAAGVSILEARSGGEVTDTGFRYFRVDTSNMRINRGTPDQVDQEKLALRVDTVRPGRSSHDLLFEVLLDWGLDLELAVEIEQVGDNEVLVVDGGALVASFSEKLPVSLLRSMAELQPLRAVFRDTSFPSDSDRINASQIFSELSPHTDMKVI